MARILICEDDWPTLQLFRMLMEKGGFEVSLAHNAQDVLALLKDGTKPDLIMLDVMLPDIDGLTLCKTLREQQISVPILMMSASSDDKTKSAGLAAGANEYLTKPLLQYDLIQKARSYLSSPSGS